MKARGRKESKGKGREWRRRLQGVDMRLRWPGKAEGMVGRKGKRSKGRGKEGRGRGQVEQWVKMSMKNRRKGKQKNGRNWK